MEIRKYDVLFLKEDESEYWKLKDFFYYFIL